MTVTDGGTTVSGRPTEQLYAGGSYWDRKVQIVVGELTTAGAIELAGSDSVAAAGSMKLCGTRLSLDGQTAFMAFSLWDTATASRVPTGYRVRTYSTRPFRFLAECDVTSLMPSSGDNPSGALNIIPMATGGTFYLIRTDRVVLVDSSSGNAVKSWSFPFSQFTSCVGPGGYTFLLRHDLGTYETTAYLGNGTGDLLSCPDFRIDGDVALWYAGGATVSSSSTEIRVWNFDLSTYTATPIPSTHSVFGTTDANYVSKIGGVWILFGTEGARTLHCCPLQLSLTPGGTEFGALWTQIFEDDLVVFPGGIILAATWSKFFYFDGGSASSVIDLPNGA